MRIFPEKGSYAGIFEVFIFSLLMSLPASYEPNHFAKVFFVTSFFHSLSWGIVLWVIASTKLRKLSAIVLCFYIFYYRNLMLPAFWFAAEPCCYDAGCTNKC